MPNDPIFERFREISWQRALTDRERAELEAWLNGRPEFRAEWEAELALSVSLAKLPEPAVPSNFTARVLQAVERENATEPGRAPVGWWHALARKARLVAAGATIGVVVLLGVG